MKTKMIAIAPPRYAEIELFPLFKKTYFDCSDVIVETKKGGQELIVEPIHLSMMPGDQRRYLISGNWKSNGDKVFI